MEIVRKHGIKKILTFEAVTIYHVNSMVALLNLLRCVTAKAYAIIVQPLYLSHQPCELFSDQTRIKCLIEVNAIPTMDDFVKLLLRVVSSSKDVVVHEYKFVSSLDGYLVYVHIWTDIPFLSWHHTPRASVWASASEEPICIVFWYVWIYGVVWLTQVYFIRQLLGDGVSCATPNDLLGIAYDVAVVWREVEDLGHVNNVIHILAKRAIPLYAIAMLLVVASNFAERKIGIYCRAPLFLLCVSVYIY